LWQRPPGGSGHRPRGPSLPRPPRPDELTLASSSGAPGPRRDEPAAARDGPPPVCSGRQASSWSSRASRESADGAGAAEPETAAVAEAEGVVGAVAELGARSDCGVGVAGDSASAEGPKLSTSSAAAPSADAPAVARLRREGVSSSMRPPASGVGWVPAPTATVPGPPGPLERRLLCRCWTSQRDSL